MHLVNVVATPLWGVRIVRPAIVDGAQRRCPQQVGGRRRPLQFRKTAATGFHYCRSQRQRLQRAGQAFFNLVDQLGNIDRLGERTVSLNAETRLCLRHCD